MSSILPLSTQRALCRITPSSMATSARVSLSACSFSNSTAIASRQARKRRRRPSLNSPLAGWTKEVSANSCVPTRSGRRELVAELADSNQRATGRGAHFVVLFSGRASGRWYRGPQAERGVGTGGQRAALGKYHPCHRATQQRSDRFSPLVADLRSGPGRYSEAADRYCQRGGGRSQSHAARQRLGEDRARRYTQSRCVRCVLARRESVPLDKRRQGRTNRD